MIINWMLVDRFAAQIVIFFLLWRLLRQGRMAIKRMLEMEAARTRMVTDLKRDSERLIQRQDLIAKDVAKKVALSTDDLTKNLEAIRDKIEENTELTKLAILDHTKDDKK